MPKTRTEKRCSKIFSGRSLTAKSSSLTIENGHETGIYRCHLARGRLVCCPVHPSRCRLSGRVGGGGAGQLGGSPEAAFQAASCYSSSRYAPPEGGGWCRLSRFPTGRSVESF